MAFNTQQGKDNVFVLSVCLCAPGPFFFFGRSMKLPTLSLVINWNNPAKAPNQHCLPIGFLAFCSGLIAYEKEPLQLVLYLQLLEFLIQRI